MTYTWDLPTMQEFRGKKGKKVKAFKAGSAPFRFHTMSQARDSLGYSRYLIKKHIESGELLDGYYFEFA